MVDPPEDNVSPSVHAIVLSGLHCPMAEKAISLGCITNPHTCRNLVLDLAIDDTVGRSPPAGAKKVDTVVRIYPNV